MKFFSLILVYLCVGFFLTSAYSQSLVEDANLTAATPESGGENLFTETIKIISQSKKIFILTNNNQKLGPGDFVSLAYNNQLAARAMVAKTHQGQAGLKIIKIYSLAQWGKLRRNQDIQVIKGDDSYFGKKIDKVVDATPVGKIKNEEDLYTGDVVVEDELGDFEDNKNRHIKPDNIVGIFGAFQTAAVADRVATDGTTTSGGKARATEFGASWAYQFADNFFAEGLYGRALYNSFPSDGIQTLVNRFEGRIKYNIKGPLYTFFMPYVGYQNNSVSSPDAGQGNVKGTLAGKKELDAVDKLKKAGPVVGVTILRRLVPGWFVRADLGTDMLGLGFSIEF
jgi:hypothetical protein